MKLATTTGDLAAYYADRSVAAPVRGMAATGFRHLDLSIYRVIYKGSPWLAPGDGWKREIEDVAAAAAADGLDFCQSHAPDGEHFAPGETRDALILATRRAIEACGMLGIPCTVIHAQGYAGGSPEEFLAQNVAFFRLFAEDAEKHGVDMLVENSAEQWNPEYYLRTGRELADFVRAAGIPRLHICWDIGHGNVQNRDQYSDIMDMGAELRAIHAQDNDGNADSHRMPLSGTVNFDRVLQGLIDVGYKGTFTFEGGKTLRRRSAWPHYRRDVKPEDRLADPPLYIQQKQIAVMYEVGKWMLQSYGIFEE